MSSSPVLLLGHRVWKLMFVNVVEAHYLLLCGIQSVNIRSSYKVLVVSHQKDKVHKFSSKSFFIFSDEAHFWLNGYVNKQNCRIWSEANPQVYVERPLPPEKLTVWCALWAGGIIGLYFFKNDEGHNVTVNARATIDLLKDTFGDRLISRFGPVNWPPRSCDLTPLDYFLWGYVKSLVYADKPQTLDHLEDNIRRVIADIRPQMLEKVIENWTSRLDYIRASRGSHMPEIIFKMINGFMSLTPYSQPPVGISSRNQDSSLHATHFQSSILQSMCSPGQARYAARWRALSNGALIGRRLPKPKPFSERCTVRLLTVRLAPSFK
ncbi:putative transposase [Trichonephila clavipes]|nr:putative transposase [Trichonephila clavipes]